MRELSDTSPGVSVCIDDSNTYTILSEQRGTIGYITFGPPEEGGCSLRDLVAIVIDRLKEEDKEGKAWVDSILAINAADRLRFTLGLRDFLAAKDRERQASEIKLSVS